MRQGRVGQAGLGGGTGQGGTVEVRQGVPRQDGVGQGVEVGEVEVEGGRLLHGRKKSGEPPGPYGSVHYNLFENLPLFCNSSFSIDPLHPPHSNINTFLPVFTSFTVLAECDRDDGDVSDRTPASHLCCTLYSLTGIPCLFLVPCTVVALPAGGIKTVVGAALTHTSALLLAGGIDYVEEHSGKLLIGAGWCSAPADSTHHNILAADSK